MADWPRGNAGYEMLGKAGSLAVAAVYGWQVDMRVNDIRSCWFRPAIVARPVRRCSSRAVLLRHYEKLEPI